MQLSCQENHLWQRHERVPQDLLDAIKVKLRAGMIKIRCSKCKCSVWEHNA
jgi:hypothetical protein